MKVIGSYFTQSLYNQSTIGDTENILTMLWTISINELLLM